MTITTRAARDLAVIYAAYRMARRDNSHQGILCWGRSLLDAQRETGVEIIDPSMIESALYFARRDAARAA